MRKKSPKAKAFEVSVFLRKTKTSQRSSGTLNEVAERSWIPKNSTLY
jgi:hypothetical protein